MRRICHVCKESYETVNRACWVHCNKDRRGHRICIGCVRRLIDAKILVQQARYGFKHSPWFTLIEPYVDVCPTAGLLAAVRIIA